MKPFSGQKSAILGMYSSTSKNIDLDVDFGCFYPNTMILAVFIQTPWFGRNEVTNMIIISVNWSLHYTIYVVLLALNKY